MRILVAALGSPGHAFPLVPLSVALHDGGHDVTFATNPDIVDTVATSGVPTTTVGGPVWDTFGAVMRERGMTGRPSDQETMRSVAGEVFGARLPRSVAADLLPRLRDEQRPDLVVAEVGDPGAAIAARVAGVPCVLHSFGRRPTAYAPFPVTASAPLVALAGELGLGMAEGDAIAHAYLDVCPPSLQDPASQGVLDGLAELPLRPTGWNPPTPFTSRLAGDRAWVLLTLGTAFGEAGVLRAAVAGIAATGVGVLVATGSVEAGELADVAGEHVQVEPFVPQADLLAGRVAGVAPPAVAIHHGGSGTTLACAAAGVPQLFLPQGADQFFNAAAVVATGAGRQLLAEDATATAVGDTVRALLTDGAPERRSAAALAAEIAALPSPADVAAAVEDWAQPEM